MSYRLSLRRTKFQSLCPAPGRLTTFTVLAGGVGSLLILSVILPVDLQLPVQLGIVGASMTGLLMMLGREVTQQLRQPQSHGPLALLETPFLLAADRDLFTLYQQLTRSLLQVSQRQDPIFRAAALAQLGQMVEQVGRIAMGTLVYEGTETWRMVYETLLRSRGIYRYRSVAWLQHAGYWLDEPGQQSMQLNFELQAGTQVQIERIAIIAESLWPRGAELPIEPVRQWIHEQHASGIDIRLVRQTDIAREPELGVDMGIYGSRAVGFQELDESCQTVRFTLTFDFDRLVAAEKIWERLMIYASRYENLLDRPALDAYDPEPADSIFDE